MKKIIIWILLLIIIPLIIVVYYSNLGDYNYFKSRVNNIIRVKRLETNVIDILNIEDYTLGVLAGEMPVNFELEALKAQAVAARSYVISRLNDDLEYDVVDSVLNQVYLDDSYLRSVWKDDYDSNISKLKEAVDSTNGEYLTYNDKVADTLFFSTSNGYTENSKNVFSIELPYLVSVESKWDETANPNFLYVDYIDINTFCIKLELSYCNNILIEDKKISDSNRVESITINSKLFTGREVYNLLGIRSTDFSLNIYNEYVEVTTKGYGHGVGMSQYGANGMAKEGYLYDEILQYYYQGTKIKKIV